MRTLPLPRKYGHTLQRCFGVAVEPPAAANPFFFTGQRLDILDGGVLVLYDYKGRVYDPLHGRFQQRDPSEFADTYNLYEYAASRPTVLTDPTGEFSLPEISLSSLISRGLQAFNVASTARDVLRKARLLAGGASFQSVLLAFVVEQALDPILFTLLAAWRLKKQPPRVISSLFARRGIAHGGAPNG